VNPWFPETNTRQWRVILSLWAHNCTILS
jgi:hypothetical protein